MAVRRAKDSDLTALTSIGLRFLRWSPYARYAKGDGVMRAIRGMLANGAAWIGEVDGEPVGMLIAQLAPPWFAPDDPDALHAVEMAWWVDEEHRGSSLGLRLLDAFEAWAKELGVPRGMSDLGEKCPVDKLFARRGYRLVERAFIGDN